jgi:hypothetical protein
MAMYTHVTMLLTYGTKDGGHTKNIVAETGAILHGHGNVHVIATGSGDIANAELGVYVINFFLLPAEADQSPVLC